MSIKLYKCLGSLPTHIMYFYCLGAQTFLELRFLEGLKLSSFISPFFLLFLLPSLFFSAATSLPPSLPAGRCHTHTVASGLQ